MNDLHTIVILEATKAVRERCARIAEEYAEEGARLGLGAVQTAQAIAKKIREIQ